MIGACHALVQRALPEALGLCPVAEVTTPLLPTLDPPAELDTAALFADDGLIAGRQSEVARAIAHLQQYMPALGLRFSKIDIVPAQPDSPNVDARTFEAMGCTLKRNGNFEVMKSPVGDSAWCSAYVQKRTVKLGGVCARIAQMTSGQAALYLLRYQSSRMIYTIRTTPLALCGDAIACADRTIQATLECILAEKLSPVQAERARLPTRLGGLGLQSLSAVADAAYVASSSKAMGRVAVLRRCVGRPPGTVAAEGAMEEEPAQDSYCEEAANRLASRLPGGRIELEDMQVEGDGFRQQRLSLAVCEADCRREPLQVLRVGPGRPRHPRPQLHVGRRHHHQAQCRPGCHFQLRLQGPP